MTQFWAIIGKVQTMADGGIRVYLDLPETALVEMAELAAYQINAVVVDVTIEPRNTGLDQGNGKERHKLEKGAKRQSKWETAEGQSPN